MMQNIPREKILEALKDGPTLPIKIAKQVGGDSVIVGAILSTLIESGSVAISSMKVGGSPLYYIPGQEEKLESFVDKLNEKDQKTFAMLKEKNILQDDAQDPLIRVSLRALKDFAKQFEIDFEGKRVIFWRFYSYDKAAALLDAKNILLSQKPIVKEPPKVEAHPLALETYGGEKKAVHEVKHHKAKKTEEKPTETPEHKPEAPEPENLRTYHKPKAIEKPEHNIKAEEHRSEIKEPDIADAIEKDAIPKKDFFEQIKEHIHSMKLDIISKEKIKKSEYTLVLKNHDTNDYIYCVAKDKKSINEGDLSTAFVYSQSKKMPCMFIMTGSLTKKAEQMRAKEFKDMRIEKIE